MITFPHIGFIGRLGNQMFQYAALYSMSKKFNLDFALCKNNLELYKCFNISAKVFSHYYSEFVLPNGVPSDIVSSGHNIVLQTEEQNGRFLNTAFDSNFYNTNHDNKSILGFFQNYKYFIDFEKDIRKQFVFKERYKNIAKFYLEQTFQNKKIIALHIRRTDYLNSHFLNNLTLDYYNDALSHFDLSIPTLVFSDDPDWCEGQDCFSGDRFHIMRSGNTYLDLCLMSMCNYHIIANSTYSWWGSWLAKSEKTICPKKWFQPYASFVDSNGLRLPHWISI